MRTPQEIIDNLKQVTYWSQPNMKYQETMDLINELESSLNPTEEILTEIIEPEITKEPQTILIKDDSDDFSEFDVEITIEEPNPNWVPTPKPPVVKKTTSKKSTTKK